MYQSSTKQAQCLIRRIANRAGKHTDHKAKSSSPSQPTQRRQPKSEIVNHSVKINNLRVGVEAKGIK